MPILNAVMLSTLVIFMMGMLLWTVSGSYRGKVSMFLDQGGALIMQIAGAAGFVELFILIWTNVRYV